MGSENTDGCVQNREWRRLKRFRAIAQRWRWISQSLFDETLVLSVNVENKELSKQWMNPHLPNKPKMYTIVCLPGSRWQLFSGTGKELS
jgi:hypothetical protein